MRPQKTAHIPRRTNKYLPAPKTANVDFLRFSWKKVRISPKTSIIVPCPISPNMSPKRKGKLDMVITAGLTS